MFIVRVYGINEDIFFNVDIDNKHTTAAKDPGKHLNISVWIILFWIREFSEHYHCIDGIIERASLWNLLMNTNRNSYS